MLDEIIILDLVGEATWMRIMSPRQRLFKLSRSIRREDPYLVRLRLWTGRLRTNGTEPRAHNCRKRQRSYHDEDLPPNTGDTLGALVRVEDDNDRKASAIARRAAAKSERLGALCNIRGETERNHQALSGDAISDGAESTKTRDSAWLSVMFHWGIRARQLRSV
jgi:hypothetical protein